MSDSVAGPVIFFSILIGSSIISASLIRMLFGCWPWASRPTPTVQERRDALHPSGPSRPGFCPICGMDDPDHLEARWRTWPVHADCLEWLIPGGPSRVDEYANPALSGSRRLSPASSLAGVTTAEASAALAVMFAPVRSVTEAHPVMVGIRPSKVREILAEMGVSSATEGEIDHFLRQQARPPVEVTTMGDPAPVYLESRKP